MTIGAAFHTGDFTKLAVCIPAQILGAFLGATLVWLHYLPHWAATPEQDLKLAVFCTGPRSATPPANLISEVVATFLLVFTIAALVTSTVGTAGAFPRGVAPYLVAMLVWGIGLSLGGTTGYAINPRPRPRPPHRPRGAPHRRKGLRIGVTPRSPSPGR